MPGRREWGDRQLLFPLQRSAHQRAPLTLIKKIIQCKQQDIKVINIQKKRNLQFTLSYKFDTAHTVPTIMTSVGDPDQLVFGPPGSETISQKFGSRSSSFPFLIKVFSGLKYCLQNMILTQNFSKKLKFLRLKVMCLRVI